MPLEDGYLRQKQLSLLPLTMLVTGNMMGSGIFLLPASLADIGSISLLGWLVTSIGAIALSLVFVRLRSLNPEQIGLYAFIHAGLGRYVGSQVVYGYWVAIWIGNMAVALSAVGYLSYFFPSLDNELSSCLTAIALIWVLTLLNLRDVRFIGHFQVVTTCAMLVPVIGVSLCGWYFLDGNNLISSFNVSGQSHYLAFSESVTLTLWSFVGLESACNLASHAQNPRRDVPLATFLGTSIAACLYVASTTAMMGVVPSELLRMSASPFALAAVHIFGHWVGEVVCILAVVACLGSLNGWVLMHGQVARAAALDRLLPSIFCKLNRHGSPYIGLLVTALVMSVMLVITTEPSIQKHFEFIILIAVYLMLLAYTCACLSCYALQKRSGQKTLSRWNLILFLACCYCGWGLVGAGLSVLLYGSVLLMTGGVMYWWVQRKSNIKPGMS